MLLHSNAHAMCHRWFNEALQKLTLLPKNLGICSSMDLMSFHADQSLSLFIYFLGKVFIIQFLSYINHTLLFLRNPIGKLTIEMITSLHITNFFDRVETMYACKGQWNLKANCQVVYSSKKGQMNSTSILWCIRHSMARANLKKSVWLVTNTTTASKYIPK